MSSALQLKSVRRPRSVRHKEVVVGAAHVAAAEPAVPEDAGAAAVAAADVAGQVVVAAAQAVAAVVEDEVVQAADAKAARVAHVTERDVMADVVTVAAKAEASSSRTSSRSTASQRS